MVIKKILFPTKFRELAYESLEALFPLKNAGLDEVVLCHVISRDDVGFVPFGGYLKDEEHKLREEAEIRFEDWQKSLEERGIGSKVIVSVGDPVHEILKTAEKERIDLLVVGRKRRVEIVSSFIGSHTHSVLTRSKYPTFVSKYMVEFDWEDATLTKVNKLPFETPFFAADWTDRSKRAIELLISLKDVINKVMVFYNIDEKTVEKLNDAEMASFQDEINGKLDDYCSQLRVGGVEAETHVGAGGMLDEILRVSRERKASMIVIGNTSEDRFLSNILDRSLSYQVTKESELPVLLVP